MLIQFCLRNNDVMMVSSIIITFSLGNCNVSLLVVPLSPKISILIGPTVSAKCESRVVHVTKYFEDRFVESLLKLLTARCGDAFLDITCKSLKFRN